jgi:hypothetical protein
MTLQLNPSAPAIQRYEPPHEVVQLKRRGAVEAGALREETLSSRVGQVPFLARFAVINLVGVALLAAAWAEGILLKPYRADESGMSYLITALFVIGLVSVARKDWQSVRWIGNTLVFLGMVGTVLGLIMTVSNLSVDNAQNFESFKAIITSIYIGAGIALYTNLLACIGYLWLGTNAHLLAGQEV